ncbi:MAG: PAS domain-containing protein [Proteobacteria bacterium]|nr:PAS domain-containing protein [Pseudomonadota bacterium]
MPGSQAASDAALLPASSDRLDWLRVAEWTQRIIEADIAPIERVFASHSAAALELAWEPAPEQLAAPPLRFLLEQWLRLTQGIGLPLARKINPFELEPALGYLVLLEPTGGGHDFRFRLYGSRFAELSGFDMTGKLLSEYPVSAYAAEFGIAVYRAAMHRRRPLYTRNRVGAKFPRRWRRLVLPYADASGAVARLLCGRVADARAI